MRYADEIRQKGTKQMVVHLSVLSVEGGLAENNDWRRYPEEEPEIFRREQIWLRY